jgi:hypothetical protein
MRLANSVAETSNSDPGSPTWPNLSSSCASAGWLSNTSNTIHNSLDSLIVVLSFARSSLLFGLPPIRAGASGRAGRKRRRTCLCRR